MLNTFFQPSDEDEEEGIKVQMPSLKRSTAQQIVPLDPASLFHDSQFEEGSTIESTKEDQAHSLT